MSNNNNVDTANYIFRARTKEAFVIKVLSELLANANLQFAPFRIDGDGIHLNAADRNNHQLINFSLFRENFYGYKCTRPLNFMVNSSHFHKLLKVIKKKDTITLFIKDDDNCKLGICVETSDENNKTNTNIRITYIQQNSVKIPDSYPNPTICTNKEFQKMKNLHNIASEMTVSSPYPGLIKFYCDGKDVYDREVVLGNEAEEEDIQLQDDDEKNPAFPFCETFRTSYITGLTKCANQSGNVQLFVRNKMPLKIKMKAGNLGELTVYIKSLERIKLEQKIAAEKKKQEQDQADGASEENI